MGKLTAEQYAELETKFVGKRLARVDLKVLGTFVFRAPIKPEFAIFQAMRLDDANRLNAYADLALRTVVYPEPAELLRLVEEYAGLLSNGAFVRSLNVLNGSGLEEEGKG